MAEMMEVIRGRRSIRKYQETEIPDDVLTQVLDSVRWAPSWANTQCWEVVVVRDRANKEKLQEAISKTNPGQKAVGQAPVVLVLCGKLKSSGYYKGEVTTKFGDWFMFDLGIAAQNICLAAHGLGLGTVMLGMFDHDKAAEILGVPDTHELVTVIPMGYPAKEASAPKRREIGEFVHYESF